MNAIQYSGNFLKNIPRWIFTFTSWESLTQVLILLGGLYLVFSFVVFIIIGIRRISKRWRHETVTDLILLKLIAVSFLYILLVSLFFMPYIAVICWIIGYFLMKRGLKKDIFALCHIHCTYSPNPRSSLKSYKKSVKDDIALIREDLIPFKRIYMCSSIMLGFAFWCGVLTSSQDAVPEWLFLINANISFFTFILSGFVLHIVTDDLFIMPDNGGKWGWLAALILIFGVGGNMLVLSALHLI